MTAGRFPTLDPAAIQQTREALHAYARVLGDCLKRCRTRRKHWWHASLRPTLNGLSTGIGYSRCDFELEINLKESVLCSKTVSGEILDIKLEGQSAAEFAARVAGFLEDNRMNQHMQPETTGQDWANIRFPGYSANQATSMANALSGVTAAMVTLRSGIREQSSPIQLWPHHFDLSMLWLPGTKIPGQDPADEEVSDKQVNFGFTFGDEVVPEPYFYITAYPLPEDMHRLPLPSGASWRTEGFNGVFLPYRLLNQMSDPLAALLSLWEQVLSAARKRMMG